MLKFLLLLFIFSSPEILIARVHKHKIVRKNKKHNSIRSTAVSFCKRNLIIQNDKSFVENKNFPQAVIVAIETDSEKKCHSIGRSKAEQYSKEGWKCIGQNTKEMYSCVSKSSSSFAVYKNIELDHLLFTNLTKHRSLIAYLNPNSYETCLEDKKDIESGGVTDAKCYSRSKKSH